MPKYANLQEELEAIRRDKAGLAAWGAGWEMSRIAKSDMTTREITDDEAIEGYEASDAALARAHELGLNEKEITEQYKEGRASLDPIARAALDYEKFKEGRTRPEGE